MLLLSQLARFGRRTDDNDDDAAAATETNCYRCDRLQVILASQSARRRDLLRHQVGVVSFECIVSDFEEDLDKKLFSTAESYCLATTMGKMEDILQNKLSKVKLVKKAADEDSEGADKRNAIAEKENGIGEGASATADWDIVICADTIVCIDHHSTDMITAAPSPSSQSASPSSTFEILEKANTAEEAFDMISKLQGRRHRVITTMAVAYNIGADKTRKRRAFKCNNNNNDERSDESRFDGSVIINTHVESVGVTFAPLSPELVREYAYGVPSCCSAAAALAATSSSSSAPSPSPLPLPPPSHSHWRGKAGAYRIQDVASRFISRIEGDYYAVMGLPVHALSGMLAARIEPL